MLGLLVRRSPIAILRLAHVAGRDPRFTRGNFHVVNSGFTVKLQESAVRVDVCRPGPGKKAVAEREPGKEARNGGTGQGAASTEDSKQQAEKKEEASNMTLYSTAIGLEVPESRWHRRRIWGSDRSSNESLRAQTQHRKQQ